MIVFLLCKIWGQGGDERHWHWRFFGTVSVARRGWSIHKQWFFTHHEHHWTGNNSEHRLYLLDIVGMMIYFCLHTSIDHTGLIGPRQGHTPTYWSVICFRSKHWSYSCSHSPVPWFCPAVLAWLTTTHCVTNALNLMKWGRSGNASILLPVAFCNRIQMWWCLCTHKIWKLDHHYRLKKSARRGWRIRSKVPTNTIPHMYTEIYSIYIIYIYMLRWLLRVWEKQT